MIRCYDYGRELTAKNAIRRDVAVSQSESSGGIYRRGGGYEPVRIGTSHTARVDLCRNCDDERDRQDEARAQMLKCVLWVLVGIIIVALVSFAGFVYLTWPTFHGH